MVVHAAVTAGPMSRLPPEILTRLLDGHAVVRIAAGEIFYRSGGVTGVQPVVDGLLHVLAMNAFWPVRRRLGRHLLDLAADERQGQVLLVRANHQELADAVGTVREVVARTLSTFRTSGYITNQPDGIRILDPAALAELSN